MKAFLYCKCVEVISLPFTKVNDSALHGYVIEQLEQVYINIRVCTNVPCTVDGILLVFMVHVHLSQNIYYGLHLHAWMNGACGTALYLYA